MNYCVSYKSSHKQEADEIKVPVNQLGILWSFIKDNLQKRYCILFNEVDSKGLEQLAILKEGKINYVCAAARYDALFTLFDRGEPAYLTTPITDWESFNILKNLGVTDIYIDGPLGFQMEAIKRGKGDIKIRVSPSVSPNTSPAANSAINNFFIRPEDISLYSDAIDVIDFNIFENEKEDTLFKIYKSGSSNLPLEVLITGYKGTVLNSLLSDQFAVSRYNCGQKCQIPGYSCHICEKEELLSQNIGNYFQSYETT